MNGSTWRPLYALVIAAIAACSSAGAVDGISVTAHWTGTNDNLYGGYGSIVRHDIVDDVVTHTTIYAGPARHPVISPDGTRVAFIKQNNMVSVMGIAGGTVTEVAEGHREGTIDWPDDDWIYYNRGGFSQPSQSKYLRRVHPDGTGDAAVFTFKKDDNSTDCGIWHFGISADLTKAAVRPDDTSPNPYGCITFHDMSSGRLLNARSIGVSTGDGYRCSEGMDPTGGYVMVGNVGHTGMDIRQFSSMSVTKTVTWTTAASWGPDMADTGTQHNRNRWSRNSPDWVCIHIGWGTRGSHGANQMLINWSDERRIVVTENTDDSYAFDSAGDFWVGEPDPAKVATPVISPDGGSFSSAQSVTMTCATTGATIRYTTDGSPPTSGSAEYTSAITVDASCVVKACAFKSGMTDSDVASATFTIGSALPAPWQQCDVGSVVAGGASYAAGVFTVDGAGDVWNAADGFHFVYQTLTGDGQITARVTAIENTHEWAKACVMVRESLNAGSRHGALALTPGNGLAFLYRPESTGSSSYTAGAAVSTPYWVRVVKTGSSISAHASPDGVTWVTVGAATIDMGGTVYVGLALTSGTADNLNTSTFDNVAVEAAAGANEAPTVDAGDDFSTYAGAPDVLVGSASDDGLPSGQLDLTWSKVSGPGDVTFDAPDAETTGVTFAEEGVYVVRLTASDGDLESHDEVSVTVELQPTVSVVSPDGGEVWYVGTRRCIVWTTDDVDNVALYYSVDGGSTPLLIEPSILSTDLHWGSYVWTVPDAPTTQGRILMTAYIPGLGGDSSDADFEIRAVTDSDADGMDDGWEQLHFSTLAGGGEDDGDDDGLSDLQEFLNGTDPSTADSDGDGIPDEWEVMYGIDPTVDDADLDPDGDGYTSAEEYEADSDPRRADSSPGMVTPQTALDCSHQRGDGRGLLTMALLAMAAIAWLVRARGDARGAWREQGAR